MILKHKRRVHVHRREAAIPTPATKITILGTVTSEDGESLAFSIPEGLDPAAISLALEQAERNRIAKRAADSAELRELFLKRVALDE